MKGETEGVFINASSPNTTPNNHKLNGLPTKKFQLSEKIIKIDKIKPMERNKNNRDRFLIQTRLNKITLVRKKITSKITIIFV
jgi:hypothetical protein